MTAVPPPEDPVRLPVGAAADAHMLLLSVDRRSYGAGKECVVLTLGTAAGRITSAPLWGNRRELAAGAAPGSVVRVRGRIGSYRGSRQLELSALELAPPGSADPRRFLPSSADPAVLWQPIEQARAELRRPRLRHLLALFCDDPEFRARYQECPASTSGHHAELGGLLRHTGEVAAIARAIARTCGADQELVLAGALLHDIGKLEAYAWERGVLEYTEAGSLLGHVALGMLMLARRYAAEVVPPCTGRELLLLQHLIASHHGALEFGAAVRPMTLEAEVLHHADNASARADSMRGALADPEQFVEGALLSTKPVWQLDKRRVYRGASDWGEAG